MLICVLAATCWAQSPPLDPELGFEGTQRATGIRGWFEQPPGISFADSQIVHSGRYSGRIEGRAVGPVSLIMRILPIDFYAGFIELRAYVRTENVTGGLRIWAREDGQLSAISSAQSFPVKGTTAWTEHSLRLAIHPEGQQISYGFFVEGTGRAWIDDIQILPDAKPISEARKGRGVDNTKPFPDTPNPPPAAGSKEQAPKETPQ